VRPGRSGAAATLTGLLGGWRRRSFAATA
jgi:hypothetical protein